MSRSTVAVLLAVLAFAVLTVPAPRAHAQTLFVNPACLIGACEEDDRDSADQSPHERQQGCSSAATLVCGGKTLASGALDVAGSVASAGLDAVGSTALNGLTSWVASGAAWLVSKEGELIDRSSRPSLGSPWFTRQYRGMINLAVALAVLTLLCAVIQAVFRQDLGMLLRAAFVALPLALLLCFAAVTLVEIALGVTDWMTSAVLSDFGDDTGRFFGDVSKVLAPASIAGGVLPGFLLFIGALVTALMTFVVWLELVMREAAIYIAVAFLPLSFAAMVWQRTSHWSRRLVEGLGAIILAKFAIATAIALAGSAMGHARSGSGGWTALLGGSGVMFIAALSPWVLLRIIPLAEGATRAGFQRGAVRGAVTAAPGATTATMAVRQAMVKSFGRSASHNWSAATPLASATAVGGAGRSMPPSAPPRPPASSAGQTVPRRRAADSPRATPRGEERQSTRDKS